MKREKECILIVNKWDLVEKDSKTMVEYEEKMRYGLKYLSYAPILFISALTGQRVPKIMNLIDRVAEQAKKRITTSVLNRAFGRWVEHLAPSVYRNRQDQTELYHPGLHCPSHLCDLCQFSGGHPFFL